MPARRGGIAEFLLQEIKFLTGRPQRGNDSLDGAMARRNQRPEYRCPCARLAVSENWLWKSEERSLKSANDLGFENRVIFGWAVGICQTIGARKLLRILRDEICSGFVVRSRVQNRCKAGRTKGLEILSRYLRTDRKLQCHVDEFEHARYVSHPNYAAGSVSDAASSYVFHIWYDAPKLDWFLSHLSERLSRTDST